MTVVAKVVNVIFPIFIGRRPLSNYGQVLLDPLNGVLSVKVVTLGTMIKSGTNSPTKLVKSTLPRVLWIDPVVNVCRTTHRPYF